MKTSTLQYKVGETTMVLDENNILKIEAIGDMTDENADEIHEIMLEIYSNTQGNLQTLADMNKAGKSTPYARKMWKKLSVFERMSKIALYGINPVARVLASFMVGRTSRNNMRFFNNKEDAIAWLKD